ncbi:MAG: tRNA lysidine(34) synthetase TilS [Cyclobacteriaceae bacterium]|jgi:tRNA(Ile)-lysidine synthase|nr:tRNA lysidine(34) synthetase TilS [Cyclobacteriaceae bacterium]
MKARFESFLAQACPRGSRFVVAASGGLDSVVLAHLMHQTRQSFCVAHANFQLRGAAAEGDEAFVRQWAEARGIPFFSTRLATNNYAEETGLSIQMAARTLRYQWFEQVRAAHGYDFVATAHHLNDSIETVLLNWTRGASLEGLRGIPPIRDRVIRPLLFATRADIERYARQHDLAWREDATNHTDDYTRNRIRHHVVPVLKQINPGLEAAWPSRVNQLAGDLALIEQAVAAWKEAYWHEQVHGVAIRKEGLRLPGAASILFRLTRAFGFSWEQCEQVVRAAEGQPGKQFFSETHQLVTDRAAVLLAPQQAAHEPVVIPGEGTYQLGSLVLRVSYSADSRSPAAPATAVVSADSVSFPICWRVWQPGDWLQPLGMTGRKKISDLLIDQKIPLVAKPNVTVLESEGRIVWVVGIRTDDRVKVRPDTRSVISFTVA